MADKNRKNPVCQKIPHPFFSIDDPSYITEPLIKDVTEANTDGGSAK